MLKSTVILSFLLMTGARLAAQQVVPDSVGLTKFDSTKTKLNSGLNLNVSAPHALDTISPKLAHYKHSLDSMKRGLNHDIDSLKRLKLPTAKYTHKLDSLNRIDPLKVVKQEEAKLLAAEQKVTGAVTGVEKKINQKLTSLTQEARSEVPVPNANIPGANLNIPGAGNSLPLPNSSVPQLNNSIPTLNNPINGNINGLGDVQKDMNAVSGLPQKELSELKNVGEIGTAEKEITQVTQGAAGYEKSVTNLAKTDVQSAENLPKTLENEAKNVDGVKDLQKETQVLDNYKKLAGQADNPEALKKEALQQVEKQAVNHFAGKEQILTSAMSQISKIKQKYSTVTSLSELPKRPPNPMHGKPLIERIIPGVSFVVLKVNRQTMIDYNPWVGYRFNGRLTAGAGWNERIGISHFHFSTHRMYGPRVFGEFKLGKGFSGRGEVETMNSYLPPNQTADPSSRKWVWNSFAGLKREYKLFKYLRGNVQMLYNINSLFTKHRYNLYGDPLRVRMGFEFPMKKRVKGK